MTVEHYRKHAERCLLMAAAANDPDAASKLRQIAADYLELALDAERAGMQQVQPLEPGDEA
jgi:hypothetical protein